MDEQLYASSLKAAAVIYDNLCVKTDALIGTKRKPVSADWLVAIDDDPTSALWTAWLYHKIYAEYGYHPMVLCVGGKGLLSRYTHKKSEAELLASVCHRLGVQNKDLRLAPFGANTGANVQAVKRIIPASNVVIWCVTKRLSLRLNRTVAKQAPCLSSYYYVIEESLNEAAKTANAKGLCHKQLLFHELASILERCEKYAGTFQEPIGNLVEITPEIREADAFLRRHYRLKCLNRPRKVCGLSLNLPVKNFRSFCQFVQIFYAVQKNRRQMQNALKEEIVNMAKRLLRQKLISSASKEEANT